MIQVPVIMSAVQRKSPSVSYMGLSDKLKACRGHLATQQKSLALHSNPMHL